MATAENFRGKEPFWFLNPNGTTYTLPARVCFAVWDCYETKNVLCQTALLSAFFVRNFFCYEPVGHQGPFSLSVSEGGYTPLAVAPKKTVSKMGN